ncbi:MAG: hypothetical protein HYU76_07295 [Betaproteobacteria bacterium]|nr:hypothetical protein [Betaproteobacteria bacterium]
MRLRFKLTLIATALAAAAATGIAGAAQGLWSERAGLGLQPSRDAPAPTAAFAFGGEPAYALQARRSADYRLYGGVRELPHLGLRSTESYSGVLYALSDAWRSSFEAGTAGETSFAPRRYSLSGQLHTAFSGGGGLSVGLKYRLYDPSFGIRETAGMTGTGLAAAPLLPPGASFAQGYQLQLSYQHSAFSAFGLALGRDPETLAPGFDVPGNGVRQLTFTGQHWLTPSWALSYDLRSSDPGSSFRLQGLRLGVRYRF